MGWGPRTTRQRLTHERAGFRRCRYLGRHTSLVSGTPVFEGLVLTTTRSSREPVLPSPQGTSPGRVTGLCDLCGGTRGVSEVGKERGGGPRSRYSLFPLWSSGTPRRTPRDLAPVVRQVHLTCPARPGSPNEFVGPVSSVVHGALDRPSRHPDDVEGRRCSQSTLSSLLLEDLMCSVVCGPEVGPARRGTWPPRPDRRDRARDLHATRTKRVDASSSFPSFGGGLPTVTLAGTPRPSGINVK